MLIILNYQGRSRQVLLPDRLLPSSPLMFSLERLAGKLSFRFNADCDSCHHTSNTHLHGYSGLCLELSVEM